MKSSEDGREDGEMQTLQASAAEWVARRHGGLHPDEEAELRRWLAADPAHGAAFAEHASTWAFLNQPRETGRAEIVRAALAERRRERRSRLRFTALAAAGLAAAAVVMLALIPSRGPTTSSSPTVVVRPNVQTLPDGSRIELNASAGIAVDFTPAERRVRLLHGEALFEVEKDPARPFFVIANDVGVRAMGTAFSVRSGSSQVDVFVTEGKVQVRPPLPQGRPAKANSAFESENPADIDSSASALLVAGQHAEVSLAEEVAGNRVRVVTLSPEELARELAWRGWRVEFTDTSMSEAIEVFNQQNQVQISIHDPPLNGRRITGIFWADDPDGFVRLLESGMDVQAQRVGDQIVLRAAK